MYIFNDVYIYILIYVQIYAYSWLSLSTSSTIMGPINCGSKYFLKIPESSKKQNLQLQYTGKYLHNIYIVFTNTYIAFTLY